MTRRQNSSPQGRHVRHVVKLTAEEAGVIHERANEANVTPARYMVEAALGTAPAANPQVLIDLLLGIRRQITGETTNLNQLARAANSDTWFAEDITEAISTSVATNTKLQELLDRI